MLNCQQATRYLEIRADRPLSRGTLLALRVHIRLCPLCRRYELQTNLIKRLATVPPVGLQQARLSDEFKARLHQRLQAKLDGNA